MKKLISILILMLFGGIAIGQVTTTTLKTDLVLEKTTPMFHLNGAGAYINFYNGDLTLTRSSNQLSLAGGNLSLGTNSLLGTGSIGATGARFTKIWLTDIETTNTPTIGGVAMSTLFASTTNPVFLTGITTPTITLGSTLILANPGEINHLVGIQNNIQNQLNAKASVNNTSFTGTTVFERIQVGTSDSIVEISGFDNAGAGLSATDIEGNKLSYDFPSDALIDIREIAVMQGDNDNFIRGIQALGSNVVAQPITITHYGTTDMDMVDATLYLFAVYIEELTTITGVRYMLDQAGVYTADGYNGVGLYSYSAGTYTLVASSTNDGNIWKATEYTAASKAFSSTYAASPGLYFVAALYNTSSESTEPLLKGGAQTTNAFAVVYGLTNNAKVNATLATQASLPATTTGAAISGTLDTAGLFLY